MTECKTQIISASFSSKGFLFVVLGWFEGLSQKFLSSSVSKMLLLAGLFLCCWYFQRFFCLPCFDAVSWVTSRSTGRLACKMPYDASPLCC